MKNNAYKISAVATCVLLFAAVVAGCVNLSVYGTGWTLLLSGMLLPVVVPFMIFTLGTAIQAFTGRYKIISIIKGALAFAAVIALSCAVGIIPFTSDDSFFIAVFIIQLVIIAVGTAVEIIFAPTEGGAPSTVKTIAASLAVLIVCAMPFAAFGTTAAAAKYYSDTHYINSVEDVMAFAKREEKDIQYVSVRGTISDYYSKIKSFNVSFPEAEKTVDRDELAQKLQAANLKEVRRSSVETNTEYDMIIFNLKSRYDVLCIIPEINTLMYISPLDMINCEDYYMSFEGTGFDIYL